jgi:hypothetical protein
LADLISPPLLMSEETFLLSGGGSTDYDFEMFCVVFTAAAVVPFPKWPVERIIRMFYSASSVTFACNLNLTGETAAALATPTGFKPQILCFAAGAELLVTKIRIAANTQIYASASAAGAVGVGLQK